MNKQHYLPRFYLHHFADTRRRFHNPPIEVYDLRRLRWYTSVPKNVAKEDGFYTYTARDGTKNDTVDEYLQDIEGRVAPAVLKAISHEPLSDVDIAHLCIFVTTQMARAPINAFSATAL